MFKMTINHFNAVDKPENMEKKAMGPLIVL